VEGGGLRVRPDGGMAVACQYEDAEPNAVTRSPGRPGDATRTQVTSIMTGDVVCVRSDLRLVELRELLIGEPFSGAPVVDDHGRAVGVISRTDLIQAECIAVDGTVADIMMSLAFTVRETATVAQAAALMAYEGIHRVPVVSAEGEVVGIVSSMDVVRWLAQHDGYLIERETP
jgi:CBS-domain-containing membrane protein